MKITRKKIVSFIAKNGGTAGWSKAAAGVVSLALLTGGAGLLWNQIQAGTAFKPGKSSALQGLRSNQVMFPEEDAPGGPNDSKQTDKNDNKRLEPDDSAEQVQEGKKQENQPAQLEEQQSLMEVAQNVLVLPGQEAGSQNGALPDNLDGKNMQVYDGTGREGSGHGTTILPGSGSGSGAASSGGNGGGSGSGGGTGNAGNGTGDNGTQPGGNGNNGTVTPNPDPTPTPTPVPDPTPTPEPDRPVVDPDYPDGTDGPKLPEDVKGPMPIESYPFPDSGYEIEENQSDVELQIFDSNDLNSQGEVLYNTAVLTDWKLLCSVYAYAVIDGTRYRLTNFGDCFKVENYPQTADGDFTAKFSFRQNPNVSWDDPKYADTVEFTFKVKYAKAVFMDEAGEDGTSEPVGTRFLEENDSIPVGQQLISLYDAHPEWGKIKDSLSMIVPGVSLSADGSDPIYNQFSPKKGGRYVLYPLKRTPVPDGMEVKLYSEYSDDYRTAIYKQVLTAYPEQRKVSVPEGIYSIEPEDTSASAGTFEIPASVMKINLPARCVQDGYEVSEDNPKYSSEDGLLFNKAQTELLGIPWNQTEVIVPESVEKIVLESGNSIQTLLLKGQTIPGIDLSMLENAEIVVPSDMYEEYMLAWGSRLGTNQLSAGEDMDRVLENDAILSADRKKLYGITSVAYGLYEVPDTVTTIKEGATKACQLEEGLYLPEGITSLEKDSLSGDGIQTIYFTGDTPPEIEEGVFGDLMDAVGRGLQIVVPDGCRDTWIEAWSPVLGEEYLSSLIVEEEFSLVNEDGLRYLLTDSPTTGNVLLHAPAETMSFEELEEKAGGDVTWNRIGTRAFEDCQELSAIELPMSVESIGSEAFLDCENLDLVLSQCGSEVTLGEEPFPHGSSAAFNTGMLTLQDPGMLEYVSVFASYNCWVIDSQWNFYDVNLWGTSYRLEEAEEKGWCLYGIDWGDDQLISYLVGVSRDMTGPISGAEDCPLRQIGYYTFMNHKPEFWIPEEVGRQLEFINPYAFYNSGLSGTVTLSKGIFRVDSYAFANCKNLQEVRFDADTDFSEWNVELKDNVFSRSGVEKIVFSENTSSLQSGVFYRCDHLKEVVFTGAEPPELFLFSVGAAYLWGWEDNDQIPQIILEGDAEGQEETYIENWMYPILGYDSRESMEDEFWMEAFQNIIDFLEEEQGMDWQYVDDYIAAKSELAEYEARKILNPLFDLDEPEKPDVEIPDIKDYLYDEVEEELPYELLIPDEIVTNPDEVEIDKDFLIDDLPDGEDTGEKNPDDTETDEKPGEDSEDEDKKPSGDESDKDASDEDDGNKGDSSEDSSESDKDDGKKDDSDKPDGGDNASDKDNSSEESGDSSENGDKDKESGEDGTSSAGKEDKENGADDSQKGESGAGTDSSEKENNSSETDKKDGETEKSDKTGVSEKADSDAE